MVKEPTERSIETRYIPLAVEFETYLKNNKVEVVQNGVRYQCMLVVFYLLNNPEDDLLIYIIQNLKSAIFRNIASLNTQKATFKANLNRVILSVPRAFSTGEISLKFNEDRLIAELVDLNESISVFLLKEEKPVQDLLIIIMTFLEKVKISDKVLIEFTNEIEAQSQSEQ